MPDDIPEQTCTHFASTLLPPRPLSSAHPAARKCLSLAIYRFPQRFPTRRVDRFAESRQKFSVPAARFFAPRNASPLRLCRVNGGKVGGSGKRTWRVLISGNVEGFRFFGTCRAYRRKAREKTKDGASKVGRKVPKLGRVATKHSVRPACTEETKTLNISPSDGIL